MAKVNYRKSHIMEFVNRKEQQALDAVRNDHKNMYNATLCSIIAEVPGLNTCISAAQTLLQKIERDLDHIKEQVKIAFDLDYEDFGHERKFTELDPLYMIRRRTEDKQGKLKMIRASEENQLSLTRSEYAKVRNQLNRITKPAEMRKYLESLDFDMSFLDSYTCENVVTAEVIQNIDKKNLFPYKELTVKDEVTPAQYCNDYVTD